MSHYWFTCFEIQTASSAGTRGRLCTKLCTATLASPRKLLSAAFNMTIGFLYFMDLYELQQVSVPRNIPTVH